MKNYKAYILALAVLISLMPLAAFASDVSSALWRGDVRITNSGNTTSANTTATANISSQALIDGGFASANLSDVAAHYGGDDVAFMPSVNASYPWVFWVESISSGLNIDYDLYTGGASGGKIRYFPDDAGMSANHSDTLKLGDNFTIEQTGWWDTTAVNATAVYKPGAFKGHWISATGNITSVIFNSPWITPTGHSDPEAGWDDAEETKAYDDNTGTRAVSSSIASEAWTKPFVLTHTAIDIGTIRVWADVSGSTGADQLDIDIYDGTWHDVYLGTYTEQAWFSVELPAVVKDVTQLRVKVKNADGNSRVVYLYEVDFGGIAYVTAPDIPSGNHTVTTVHDGIWLNLYVDGVLEDAYPNISGTTGATVDTAGNYITENTFQPSGFLANGRAWVAYSDGTNYVIASSDDNGSSWVKTTLSPASAGQGDGISLVFDGTYLHVAYIDGTVFIRYRSGTPNADGSITWRAAEQPGVGKSGEMTEISQPSISVNSSGYAYITAEGGSLLGAIWRTSTNDGTWTTDDGYPVFMSSENGNPAHNITIVPLSDGKMYAIGGGASVQIIRGYYYDTDAWISENVTGNIIRDSYRFSATSYGDIVQLVYLNSDTSIRYTERDAVGTWAGSTTLKTPDMRNSSVSILSTSATGDVIVFLTYIGDEHKISFKRRIGGVWDTTWRELHDESVDTLTQSSSVAGRGALKGFRVEYDDKSGFIYTTGASSPYTVKYSFVPSATAGVPDNSENWTFVSGGSMPYLEEQIITINGTVQQQIEWEYNADIFTDLSGKGNDATPSFRTTSSDNISASLIAFEPVSESKVETFSLAATYTVLIADASPQDRMFDDGDYSKLPAEPINAMLDDAGIPRAAWWLPFLFFGICVIGFITYGATTMTRGPTGKLHEGQFDGSLLIMFIVMEALLVALGKMGPIPLWPSYLFPIAGIALIMSRKHFAWG